jgi:hypothetical protein
MIVPKPILIAYAAGAVAVLLAVALVYQAGKSSQKVAQAQAEIVAYTKANKDLKAQKVAAEKAAAVALDQANEWKARAEKDEAALKVAKAKLAALPPTHPPTALPSVPADQQTLATAFAAEGFPPILAGPNLAWPLDLSRPMYALVKDGKEYPAAIEKIGALEEVAQDLAVAKEDQTRRADALESALGNCQTAGQAANSIITNDEKIISDKDKIITQEKRGKVRWGVMGMILGWLGKVLVAAL